MVINEKKYAEKMLNTYGEKKISKLDELRNLDKKASKGANLFAAIFGTIGSLVLGFGMCIAMGVILKEFMWLGIAIGLVGIVMVSLNYFFYKRLLLKGRNKYAEQIKKLSNEILNEK